MRALAGLNSLGEQDNLLLGCARYTSSKENVQKMKLALNLRCLDGFRGSSSRGGVLLVFDYILSAYLCLHYVCRHRVDQAAQGGGCVGGGRGCRTQYATPGSVEQRRCARRQGGRRRTELITCECYPSCGREDNGRLAGVQYSWLS